MIERRTSMWVILPACILLAALAYAWGRRAAAPNDESAAVSSLDGGERLAALEREVRELRAAIRRLAARKPETRDLGAASLTRGQHDSTAPLEPPHASPDELVARDEQGALDPAAEERTANELVLPFWDELRGRIESEPVDSAWRRETEPAITRVVCAQLGPEVRVDQVFCASSLCRARVSHPTWPRIPNDRLVKFAMNRESLGTMEMQLDGSEQGATTLYFLRKEPGAEQREE